MEAVRDTERFSCERLRSRPGIDVERLVKWCGEARGGHGLVRRLVMSAAWVGGVRAGVVLGEVDHAPGRGAGDRHIDVRELVSQVGCPQARWKAADEHPVRA
jgi:hypothetical protein